MKNFIHEFFLMLKEYLNTKILRNIWFETKANIQINDLEYNYFLSKLTKCILTFYMTIKKYIVFVEKWIGTSHLPK